MAWRPYRAQCTSRQPRGPIGYRTKKRSGAGATASASSSTARTVRGHVVRTAGGRSPRTTAYVKTRWDVPSSSGLIRVLDCDLRRSTLALFVHSVRVRFTILCMNETPYTQRSCVAVGCSTSGSPCAMMSETLHASTDAGFTVATYEQRCFSDLCRLVISVDSATVWIKSG